MTLKEAYKRAAEIISPQTDDAKFDAMCLVEKVFAINRTEFFLKGNEEAEEEKVMELINCARKRASGEPLQYILGQWDFMGRTFLVGKGVLIPRPETEMIAETAIDFLRGRKNPVVMDLCSGSGCIGISIGAAVKGSKVYLIEKSEDAFSYLKKNIELNRLDNAEAIEGDIFTDAAKFRDINPDLIVSNPPYIERKVIPSLQAEVQKEPRMALDGGDDGLDFYRAIASDWIPLLREGGAVIVECGENQGRSICEIFETCDRVKKTSFSADYCGNDRMVVGNTES